ncbi:MAG TPA: tRNA nucleotidyltransferase [Porphyromonadaceae bacterium]|nr:tRNA nucleotidyltransferase [Porphyromonadaceae bacterium]
MKKCFEEVLSKEVFRVISQVADEMGLETYLIGGFVRDILLGRKTKDIDVVCVGNGIEFATAVSKRMRGSKVALFKTYGTAQVKWGRTEVEFVGARKESYHLDSRNPEVVEGTLEDDQNRRDFTINAMAVCLNKERYGEFVDPFKGTRDLEEGWIRTPCNPEKTFSDDPLRMLRAIRFATQLNFQIEEKTFMGIRNMASRIQIITKERINDELNKIMLSRYPSIGFVLLDECGLLEIIFPELKALQGVEVVKGKGHKDVFYHTLQVVDNISKSSEDLWLRWAALLHDIAKPQCKKWENNQGWTFHNHNFIGGKMVERIFRKMKLPLNEKMKYVQKLVELHMQPIVIVSEEVTDSAVRRLLFNAGEDLEDLMLLCEADITSRNRDKVLKFKQNFQKVREKLKELEERDRIRNFQPPIRGEEIMETFNLPPCREVGELKQKIKNAILDGVIPNDREEAWKYLYSIKGEK